MVAGCQCIVGLFCDPSEFVVFDGVVVFLDCGDDCFLCCVGVGDVDGDGWVVVVVAAYGDVALFVDADCDFWVSEVAF